MHKDVKQSKVFSNVLSKVTCYLYDTCHKQMICSLVMTEKISVKPTTARDIVFSSCAIIWREMGFHICLRVPNV